MSGGRSSMLLLGMCMVALLVAALRVATTPAPLPTGSSYSSQADGAQALYVWVETLGANPRRLLDLRLADTTPPATLLVLQPETVLTGSAQEALAKVLNGGGILVVAGDSLPWLLYSRSLGVTVEPLRESATTGSTPDGALTLTTLAHYRLHADGATPLLLTPAGDWLALRMPYMQGTLIVFSTPYLLTNAALRDPPTARFVWREVVSATVGSVFMIDEAHHSFAPEVAGGPPTINQLLFQTSVGRAVLFVAALTFLYLLLTGRRLGPAIGPPAPTETRRTMYEHVQMLANLYRRGGQLDMVRAAFSRMYARRLARGAGSPERTVALASALARVERARTESDLIAAVASAPADL